ncbi:pyridoxal kinase [Colletotrichum tofieldiae]|nr:pyridoxal kinase [Colletotrichum tofieldiae]
MSLELPIPDTRVLAVASHVRHPPELPAPPIMMLFTLQSLGCDVAALNTVQFSYRQWKGTKVSAQEIRDLFEGLKQSYLDDFDMMLSGYIPGAEAVVAVGDIAKELKRKQAAAGTPGNFFWVLDPVMGDNGKLYVAEEVVPAYQSLVEYADLILPNQFEAECQDHGHADAPDRHPRPAHEIPHPHIVITSVSLASPDHPPSHLSVVGSSMSPTTGEPRLFKIVFPAIDAYFSGTGDMFAALMTVRMREAVIAASKSAGAGAAGEEGLLKDRKSWLSGDDVDTPELPLARATEMVLASMHEEVVRAAGVDETTEEGRRRLHLLKSKSAELKLVRNLASLREPVVEFRARKL